MYKCPVHYWENLFNACPLCTGARVVSTSSELLMGDSLQAKLTELETLQRQKAALVEALEWYEAVLRFITARDRTRGYPTPQEWDEVVKRAGAALAKVRVK